MFTGATTLNSQLSIEKNAAQFAAIQNEYTVTNILKDDSGVSLRILSDGKPAYDAYNVSPSLDDFYLHVFGSGDIQNET